ncbi:amino acid permease [Candidatus Babeliales bacterium]|nr:amino acid permease [Candidatus Babeliales bacterium]
MNQGKISFVTAVLICLNTIMGAGIFINAKPLTFLAGSFGFISYPLCALLILPVILSIAELAKLHPVSGGLYVYSKMHLHPRIGFFAGWSYFLAKTTTSALLVHCSTTFFQTCIPALRVVPTLVLDYLIIGGLVTLNIFGVRVGGKAQYVTSAFKALPILFSFLCGFFVTPAHIAAFSDAAAIEPLTLIPVAIFAVVGFEIICSIAGLLEKPERTIKPAILTSFSIAVCVATLFQFSLYRALGPDLAQASTPLLTLGTTFFPAMPWIGQLFNGFVFASIFGGSFTILTSNCWNLHTLAKDNHLPFSNILTKLTAANTPWASLIVEGILCCLIITISQQQAPLQNMSIFAHFACYSLTSLALLQAIRKGSVKQSIMVPLLSLASCCYVFNLCLKNLITFGISFSFVSIFIVGWVLSCFFGKKSSE